MHRKKIRIPVVTPTAKRAIQAIFMTFLANPFGTDTSPATEFVDELNNTVVSIHADPYQFNADREIDPTGEARCANFVGYRMYFILEEEEDAIQPVICYVGQVPGR